MGEFVPYKGILTGRNSRNSLLVFTDLSIQSHFPLELYVEFLLEFSIGSLCFIVLSILPTLVIFFHRKLERLSGTTHAYSYDSMIVLYKFSNHILKKKQTPIVFLPSSSLFLDRSNLLCHLVLKYYVSFLATHS